MRISLMVTILSEVGKRGGEPEIEAAIFLPHVALAPHADTSSPLPAGSFHPAPSVYD
jgi:hypothetical protein